MYTLGNTGFLVRVIESWLCVRSRECLAEYLWLGTLLLYRTSDSDARDTVLAAGLTAAACIFGSCCGCRTVAAAVVAPTAAVDIIVCMGGMGWLGVVGREEGSSFMVDEKLEPNWNCGVVGGGLVSK